MKKEYIILLVTIGILILSNVISMRYAHTYFTLQNDKFQMTGVIQMKDTNGRESYIPIYKKVNT